LADRDLAQDLGLPSGRELLADPLGDDLAAELPASDDGRLAGEGYITLTRHDRSLQGLETCDE
jgi:hypothetical protein